MASYTIPYRTILHHLCNTIPYTRILDYDNHTIPGVWYSRRLPYQQLYTSTLSHTMYSSEYSCIILVFLYEILCYEILNIAQYHANIHTRTYVCTLCMEIPNNCLQEKQRESDKIKLQQLRWVKRTLFVFICLYMMHTLINTIFKYIYGISRITLYLLVLKTLTYFILNTQHIKFIEILVKYLKGPNR